MIGIYKITNNINNKIYIGQSINIERRLSEHKKCKHLNQAIDQAIQKYGKDNFSYEIIEECLLKELNEKEIYWINFYQSNIRGYNMTSGGDGRSNSYVKLTNEDVLKIHQLLREYQLTQNEIAILFNVSYQVISDINRGKSRILPDVKYPIRAENIQKIQATSISDTPKKKLKKMNYCKRCGIQITHGHQYCPQCYHLISQTVTRPDADTLLREIATSSFTAVGKKYGVSDKAIVKWCIAYGLPSKKQELKKLYKRRMNQ